MSKSLGNFFTIRDVLEKYHPEVVRYLIVNSHYRSAINYSEDNLVEARVGLERFYKTLKDYTHVAPCMITELSNSRFYQAFIAAMDDDFNTRVAIACLYDLIREANVVAKTDTTEAERLISELKAMADILGILQADPTDFLQAGADGSLTVDVIETLVAQRMQAKRDKNYQRADEIRIQLDEQGVILEDSREGTTWRRKS